MLYGTVMDSLETSGAQFYREKNEELFIKEHPEFKAFENDELAKNIDARFGVDLAKSEFNMSRY